MNYIQKRRTYFDGRNPGRSRSRLRRGHDRELQDFYHSLGAFDETDEQHGDEATGHEHRESTHFGATASVQQVT